MEALILKTTSFPAPIRERIHTSKVRVSEREDGVMLLPVEDASARPTKLFGMFADTEMSTEAYAAQKQIDKELE
ncbi:MAG: hypothetical protein LBR44_02790 [Clostridiales Family XIII bacterium]|jgi:hypothetical protein|nr:hypothetical protein [Clostridiales Family XIII bacterium]